MWVKDGRGGGGKGTAKVVKTADMPLEEYIYSAWHFGDDAFALMNHTFQVIPRSQADCSHICGRSPRADSCQICLVSAPPCFTLTSSHNGSAGTGKTGE